MKRILYANGSVLTGDDMARLVVKYATALAQAGTADSISVPAMKENSLRVVELLIGPSSQLIVEDDEPGVASGYDDGPHRALIEDKCARMENPSPIPATPDRDEYGRLYNEEF